MNEVDEFVLKRKPNLVYLPLINTRLLDEQEYLPIICAACAKQSDLTEYERVESQPNCEETRLSSNDSESEQDNDEDFIRWSEEDSADIDLGFFYEDRFHIFCDTPPSESYDDDEETPVSELVVSQEQLDSTTKIHLQTDIDFIHSIFSFFKNLKELSLVHGTITRIEGLESLVHLEYLDLSKNHISKVENLNKNKQLRRLFLNNNWITHISPAAFAGLNNLQELGLYGNDITSIWTTVITFQSIPNLVALSYAFNSPRDMYVTNSKGIDANCEYLFIHKLPKLLYYNNKFINQQHRKYAQKIYHTYFEDHPYHCSETPPLHRLKNIAIGKDKHSSRSVKNQLVATSKIAYGYCCNYQCDSLCDCWRHHSTMKGKWSVLSEYSPRMHSNPRQFEYHPRIANLMVYGTTKGEIALVQPLSRIEVARFNSSAFSSILGLSWLAKEDMFVAGSEKGQIHLYNMETMIQCCKAKKEVPSIRFEDFPSLTSVSVNCSDEYLLASGFSNHVNLYNLQTGTVYKKLKDIHAGHINVLKFSHHSPNIFATSSSDNFIKLWDLRSPTPVFARLSTSRNVMVCFSPDDKYLLASALDNEVRQYDIGGGGKLHTLFNIPKNFSQTNFTRSYYINNGDYIIVGACKQSVVWIYNARTGQYYRDVELSIDSCYSKMPLYCQSLRGDPFNPFRFSILTYQSNLACYSELREISLL